MATHFSILAWKIPWTDNSLAGYSPQGCKELDTIKQLSSMEDLEEIMVGGNNTS